MELDSKNKSRMRLYSPHFDLIYINSTVLDVIEDPMNLNFFQMIIVELHRFRLVEPLTEYQNTNFGTLAVQDSN